MKTMLKQKKAEKTKRTGSMLLGLLLLAVALTLALGTAANAAEAKPVPSIKKGVANLVKTVTTMVGFVADAPVLRLDNDSAEGDATALDLQVEEGKAPMTVNSDARVENLNADKIDGLDSSEFLTGDGKVENAANADNADLLDGQDSTAFFSGKTYLAESTGDGFGEGNGEIISAKADCDSGDRLLGGGGSGGDLNEDLVVGDGPIFIGNEEWIIFVKDNGDPDTAKAEALCADFPPLRQ